jgi:hypothetical protein
VQGANPEEVSADAGYCDDKNLALLRKQIVEPVFGQIKQLVREAGVEAQRHEAVEAQN